MGLCPQGHFLPPGWQQEKRQICENSRIGQFALMMVSAGLDFCTQDLMFMNFLLFFKLTANGLPAANIG